MAKEYKLNANGREVLGVLKDLEAGAGFAKDVLEKINANGGKRTFNSVNATLAAVEKQGYVSKCKAVCGEKFLTKYTITDKAIKELTEATE